MSRRPPCHFPLAAREAPWYYKRSDQSDVSDRSDGTVAEIMNEPTTTPELLGALECLLFMADRPLSLGELANLLEISPPAARQLLELLADRYIGLRVVEIAGGYELMTKPAYAEYLARLHQPSRVRLSPAALETLAIVAYRQPVTRPEIEMLRGVNSDGVVSTLLEHELICERGQKNAPGKPVLYGTTDKFLRLFGLANLESLPDIATFAEQTLQSI